MREKSCLLIKNKPFVNKKTAFLLISLSTNSVDNLVNNFGMKRSSPYKYKHALKLIIF